MGSRRILLINPPVLAVDPYQVAVYAEAIPFGLVQIATHYLQTGCAVDFVDMMGYLDGDFGAALTPEQRWGTKPVGRVGCGGQREVYLYGRSLAWLEARLEQLVPPDEVLVTCSISFNYEPAHQVIALCKRRFPGATVRFGGPHPTTFPEHAKGSGADEVFVGRFGPAADVMPDLSLLEQMPPIWLFRLVHGCKYNCSFCVNASAKITTSNPDMVADEVLRVHRKYDINSFSNWDPNVMLEPATLEAFLGRMEAESAPVGLKFEMGIEPDRLTPAIASQMKRAGVMAMTVPFESAEPAMLRRFGKPYTMADAVRAVTVCSDLGFDTRRFHCTWVVGVQGETYRHLFGTYFAVLAAGGQPTPFPLSVVPGTREEERHRELLMGKDLSELNGHLWPTASSMEQVELYDAILEIIAQPDLARSEKLASRLPKAAREGFEAAHESSDSA